MTPLNVLYLVRTWAFGGSHTIVLLLMEHLPKERFNIICVPYDTHSGGDETFINAAEKRGLSVAPERIPWKSRSAFFKARDTIAELVKKYDIDLIHTHDPHSNVIAGLGRKRWPCACVASPYGWWNRVFPLRSHVYYHLERSVALRNFERVVTVSQTMKKKILGGGTAEDRVRVIHTGLDLRHLENGASRDATREQLGIPADAVVVGTVSRLYVEKGHSYLLKAAARLVPDFPKLHLLIVGSGPMKAELEKEARSLGITNHVVFPGFYEDLGGALNAMDLMALPSILEEGFPTVSLEAQAMGVPVVASHIGGTYETIDEGRTGVLVKPKDVAALEEGLRPLLGNAELRESMSKAAQEWIRSQFTLDNMVQQVSATYEEAVNLYQSGS